MKVSNCCGAPPLGEIYEDMGMCSNPECREHAVFEEEEEGE